ncbi:hypothetical protein BKP37_16750 [Anaerobacillus alkalilacustris]|uniref:Uncharacterized protein n=1 Tax=Anaerobacillus alkalilacustris TaxID=393763 RepID=A0A1S2LEV9_9BACI|nr:CBO0543 family protein [Anaerobacillus alkalilacustris]OIJ11059.1 hypothetical protein BKP37_16750 [Anaerobacillus alkalilacustris]
MDRKILRFLLLLGLGLLPTIFLKKKNIKDWVISFLLNSYFVTYIDSLMVKTKRISYPARFLPKSFETSVIYDYLLCPLVCVWFNQVSYKKNIKTILLQALLFTVPACGLEYWFEKYTNLVKYNKWSIIRTFFSLFIIKLLVRGLVECFRIFEDSEKNMHEKQKTFNDNLVIVNK